MTNVLTEHLQVEQYKAAFPKAAKKFYEICKNKEIALTFPDVLLEPQYSDIGSRQDVSLETWVTPLRKLKLPIIAANMDTICESAMAIAMGNLGGMGVIHRYMDYEKQISEVAKTALELDRLWAPHAYKPPVAAAVGVKNGVVEQITKLVAAGADIIVIDVAHGHHKSVLDLLGTIKTLGLKSEDQLPTEFIVGNVATYDGVYELFLFGADTVKIGVGAGSICSTRTVTGHGIPQMLAVATAALAASSFSRPIIADGGLKSSGDVVKALAVGANAIMTGYLVAGSRECPTKWNNHGNQALYRGMASKDAQKDFYGNDPDAPEGVVAAVEAKGPVEKVIKRLQAGIRSGLSYSGSKDLTEFREKASFVQISTAGHLESLTLVD